MPRARARCLEFMRLSYVEETKSLWALVTVTVPHPSDQNGYVVAHSTRSFDKGKNRERLRPLPSLIRR